MRVDFRFADTDIRATCECGWTATGDSAGDAFTAWWLHRHHAHPDDDDSAAPTPASEEAPIYRKVKMSRGLFLVTVDEGWRSTVLCSGMYENDADWLVKLLGRKSRLAAP